MSLMEEKSLASGIASGCHKPQKGEAMKSQPDHKRITLLVVRDAGRPVKQLHISKPLAFALPQQQPSLSPVWSPLCISMPLSPSHS